MINNLDNTDDTFYKNVSDLATADDTNDDSGSTSDTDTNNENPLDLLDTIGSDDTPDSPNDGTVYDDDGNEIRLNLDDNNTISK